MKKITLFVLTIFTVATLFAAARPSLDGRAVVADSGSMPRGLFARTVGYLPGDSVTVTNPATGSTVDVLILGAIDPSEGVAILLSPEAADGLRIRPNSNVQVKLTKRSGSLDENANGSAVLSDVADEAAAKSVEVSADIDESAIVNPPASYEEVPAVAENTVAESTVPEFDETVATAPVIASVPAEIVEDKSEPETLYEEVPVIPEEKLEKVAEDSLIPVTEDEKLQKVVLVEEEPAYAEETAPVEIAAVEENVPVVAVVPVTEDASDQPVIVHEEELPALEVEKEEVAVVTEEPAENAESEVNAEAAVAEETSEDDAYQPIVLVPTEPNPPVVEIEEIAEAEPSVESPENDVVVEVVPAVTEEKEPETVTVAVAEEKPVVTNDWTNYVVPSVKNLRSGCYYVQVASLGNTENIKNFVDKYSCKYPIVLVQNSAKTSYQMMVGPLNIDEYGSVDEKFKAYGFKDAFVRKIR